MSDLHDSQAVVRYSILIDSIVLGSAKPGQSSSAIACEVLSTLPYPIERVLERHGLGRFRVVQKAKLDTPADVYRIENARPEDWIMLGTHDTPTIWNSPRADCWSRRKVLGRLTHPNYLPQNRIDPHLTGTSPRQQARSLMPSLPRC